VLSRGPGEVATADTDSVLGAHRIAIQEFLGRVRHMPNVEAEQEILARKMDQAAEMAELQLELRRLDTARGVKGKESRDIGYRLQAMTADNALLSAALKEVRSQIERTKWSNAVRAVFGDDGWAQCRQWMAAEEAALMSQFGLTNNPEGEHGESAEEEVDRPRG
jgi:hypothetical protein